MAKKVPSQNSVILDQVSVTYDETTGTVRIVCADEELSNAFALGVQRNGQLEKDLLTLLANHGVATGVEPQVPPQLADPSVATPAPTQQPQPTVPAATSTAKTTNTGVIPTIPKIKIMEDWSEKDVIPSVRELPTLDLEKSNLISLVSAKDRTATTLSSVMLAASFVRLPEIAQLSSEYKAVVVDFDLKSQGLSRDILETKTDGLLGIYEAGAITPATIQKYLQYDEKLGIHVLPVGELHENPLDYIGEKFLTKVVQVLQEFTSIVIVDTPVADTTYVMPWLIEASDVIIITSLISRGTEFDLRTWLQGHIKYQRTVQKLVALLTNVPKLQIMASFEDVKKMFNPFSIVGNIPTDSAMFLTAMKNNAIDTTFETHNMVADAYLTAASRLVRSA